MTEQEAKELLKHHSFTHDNYSHPKSENGFLGMLRPFNGELIESNFHELMSILKVLKNSFYKENIERELISSFWGICHFSKAWGVEEDGMLRRNNLITEKQVELLADWIDCISYAVMNLLEGADEEAFESYKHYLEKKTNA
ncbi:hypothetical protein F7018_11605 [Tenacibaculum aiptasiae]|uniref:Uncharacterized protein n=1 Tax=Tenacibaculum aiptasiae TaxID=426481 RepID=A0A7J5AEE5_9FLAO|nr:hypothetical protein [Tenacibaculum aiptasiae]KAB1155947.1 hypothetical protein F7018_11605 [Tenacibaculum aiptasiae]